MNYIYIIKTISLKSKTEEDRQKEFEICKINYPLWKEATYQDYITFSKEWNEYDYKISSEDNCYCDEYDFTKNNVIDNSTDINDGGVYNYVAVIHTPINHAYAMTNIEQNDIHLFKFNSHSEKYDEVGYKDSKESKFIINKIIGRIEIQ